MLGSMLRLRQESMGTAKRRQGSEKKKTLGEKLIPARPAKRSVTKARYETGTEHEELCGHARFTTR